MKTRILYLLEFAQCFGPFFFSFILRRKVSLKRDDSNVSPLNTLSLSDLEVNYVMVKSFEIYFFFSIISPLLWMEAFGLHS